MARPRKNPVKLPQRVNLRPEDTHLFEAGDNPSTGRDIGQELAPNRSPEEVAERLNRAFGLAQICAEGFRADPSTADLRDLSDDIIKKFGQALLVLGFPAYPKYFTRLEGNEFELTGALLLEQSAPYLELRRAAWLVEPCDQWPDEAYKYMKNWKFDDWMNVLPRIKPLLDAIPLSDRMLPGSIAELALPDSIIKTLDESSERREETLAWSPLKWRAVSYVHRLLEITVRGLAMTIALAPLLKLPNPASKLNYERGFTFILFQLLASEYYYAFGIPPTTRETEKKNAESNEIDSEPTAAVKWIVSVLRHAAEKTRKRIRIDGENSSPEYRAAVSRFDQAVTDLHDLKDRSKAKRLGDGWKHCDAFRKHSQRSDAGSDASNTTEQALTKVRPRFLDAEAHNALVEMTRDEAVANGVARRANALLLLDSGMSCRTVGRVLFIDADTVRLWHDQYHENGIKSLTPAARKTANQPA